MKALKWLVTKDRHGNTPIEVVGWTSAGVLTGVVVLWIILLIFYEVMK